MTEELGVRIRRLRTERGISQRELAEPGYSRGFLAAIESGHRVPTNEALAYLADRLGVDVNDLKHGRPAGVAEQLYDQLAEARRRLSCGDDEHAAQVSAAVETEAMGYHLSDLVANARLCQGDVLLHRGDAAGALAMFRRAEDEKPTGGLGSWVVGRISTGLILTGQTSAAIELVEEALRKLRQSPPVDPDAELPLLCSLIYPYLEVGAVERALWAAEDGLALLSSATHPQSIATFLTVACQVWAVRNRLSEMDVGLERALDIFTGLGLEREIGRCHWTRGYALIRLDRLDEASDELVRARTILDRVGARHFHAGATLELAEVRRRQGRLDEAEALCHEALDYVTTAHYDEGIAEADRLLGRIAIARGDTLRAEELLTRAIASYARAGLSHDLMRTHRELGELFTSQNRLDEAVRAFLTATEIVMSS